MSSRAMRLSASLVTLLLTTPAWADHPGVTENVGGGPVGTIPATTLAQGQIATFVAFEHIRMREVSDLVLLDYAATRHGHAHSVGTVQRTSLGAAFGITQDLTVSVRLPFVTRTNIREGAHEHHHDEGATNSVIARGDTSGLGDMILLGQWRFLNNARTGTEAAILAGAKLPTGRTNEKDRQGERFEMEFQAGSGSTDALAGLALTQRFGAWSLDGNILYQFVNTGAQRTNLGDRFFYNAAVSYRLFGFPVQSPASGTNIPVAYAPVAQSPEPAHVSRVHQHADGTLHDHGAEVSKAPGFALDAVLELNGQWQAQQVIAGERDQNSGSNVVYLSPGVRMSGANLSGYVSVGVPIVNEVNGLQAKPSYRVLGGLAFAF